MLETLSPTPPDSLLKVMKAFQEDPRSEKIDLGIGVYRNSVGETPVMAAVKEAERRLLATQQTKTYLGQRGDPEFLRLLGELVFGAQAPELASIQAVGGTGALRLGCDLLYAAGVRRIFVPTPSWPNHPSIIAAARLHRHDIPFFDFAEQRITLDRLLDGLAQAEPGDAVLLQACCHNPLGADFTRDQWEALADVLESRRLIAFLDLAYQGFGDGLEEDVAGTRLMLERLPNVLVAVSVSKNFGIYRERTGALYVKTAKSAHEAVSSTLNTISRADYSMSPDHGAACVRVVLSDSELTAAWRAELDGARAQVKRTRTMLAAAGINSLPMQAIAAQKGMFSTLPLSLEQIHALRDESGIYMSDAGRINVAGLRDHETQRFLAALADVVGR